MSMDLANADPEAAAFRAAAAQGRMMIKQCNDCGDHYYYPRPFCPFCMSDNTSWRDVAGRGIVFTFTVWRRKDGFSMPAMVTLDEGPIVMTRLVDCNPEDIRIGQPVRLRFEGEGDSTVPVFAPA